MVMQAGDIKEAMTDYNKHSGMTKKSELLCTFFHPVWYVRVNHCQEQHGIVL